MATTTITITSATNPTYGGCIDFDGTSTYVRTALSGGNPTVNFATPNIKRAFAFFDLSTDPTGGGTITKVELLATVASVSGTHAVTAFGTIGTEPSGTADEEVYVLGSVGGADLSVSLGVISSGAQTLDLGAGFVTEIITTIGLGVGVLVCISLSNEAVAGSVVFDAAVGFGLRLTYTGGNAPSGLGVRRGLLLGA